MDEATSEILRSHLFKLAGDSRREDGRRIDQFRPIVLQPGFVTSAEGSCRAQLGRTDVVVGIKIEMGTPYPDSPDVGTLVTNCEMMPMASPDFESGPPSPASIEIARVVDRGIRESRCFDTKALCVEVGKKVWTVFIDMHIVDFDGNLFDCATLGAITALMGTHVPAKKKGLGEDYKLPIQHFPISVTTAKLDRTLLVDPTHDEESCAQGRLTITTDENGDLRAGQKGGRGAYTVDEVRQAVQNSRRIGPALRNVVRDALRKAGQTPGM